MRRINLIKYSEYIEKSLGISGFQGFENGNSYVYSEI